MNDERRELAHQLRAALNNVAIWADVLERYLKDSPPAAARALEGIRIAIRQQAGAIAAMLERPVAGDAAGSRPRNRERPPAP